MPSPSQSALTILLRRREVERATGLSRSTIYLRIAQGLWPKPVSLGARAVGWPADEVQTLNTARVAGRSDDQIRELVAGIERARVTADAPR
jgi:prophage regulatory protein